MSVSARIDQAHRREQFNLRTEKVHGNDQAAAVRERQARERELLLSEFILTL